MNLKIPSHILLHVRKLTGPPQKVLLAESQGPRRSLGLDCAGSQCPSPRGLLSAPSDIFIRTNPVFLRHLPRAATSQFQPGASQSSASQLTKVGALAGEALFPASPQLCCMGIPDKEKHGASRRNLRSDKRPQILLLVHCLGASGTSVTLPPRPFYPNFLLRC